MAEGVDYSFSAPSAVGLAAAGKRFAGRYVGPGSGKFLTPAERDALFVAGLDIFLLAEGAADSALGGYSVGVEHARLARDHARVLGAPESTTIYFAVDYDVSSKGWAAPRDYLAGACSVLGRNRVGVYGEFDVMGWAQRDGVADWFFQTYAWSAGQWFGGNHVEQYYNGVIVAGGEVDLCRSMVPNFGQWTADGRDLGQIFPSFPERGDDDMFLIRQRGSGAAYVYNGQYRTYLDTPEKLAAHQALGLTPQDVDDVTLFGIEFAPTEYYADRDNARAADAKVLASSGAPGSSSAPPSHDELAQAAFEGAQRAERE